MIGAREFALMLPHAFFVTTARGFIHDEEALYEVLRDKRIAGCRPRRLGQGAAAAGTPLLQFDNVLASPHTAGVTQGSAGEHGQNRRRTDSRCAGRQAAAARRQSRGMAGLCEALRAGVRICAEISHHLRERRSYDGRTRRSVLRVPGAAAALCRLGQRSRAAFDPGPWRARPLPQLGCDREGLAAAFPCRGPDLRGHGDPDWAKEAATA